MLDGTGELIFSPEMLRQVVIVDETKVSLDWWEQYAGRWTSGHVLSRPPSSTDYEVGCKGVLHQRWATWQIKELYISSLPVTEEMTIWATLIDGQRQTRPI